MKLDMMENALLYFLLLIIGESDEFVLCESHFSTVLLTSIMDF